MRQQAQDGQVDAGPCLASWWLRHGWCLSLSCCLSSQRQSLLEAETRISPGCQSLPAGQIWNRETFQLVRQDADSPRADRPQTAKMFLRVTRVEDFHGMLVVGGEGCPWPVIERGRIRWKDDPGGGWRPPPLQSPGHFCKKADQRGSLTQSPPVTSLIEPGARASTGQMKDQGEWQNR